MWVECVKKLLRVRGIGCRSNCNERGHVVLKESLLYCLPIIYTEKNLLVNFTFFIRKFIIFIVTLGHTQNVGFLLF